MNPFIYCLNLFELVFPLLASWSNPADLAYEEGLSAFMGDMKPSPWVLTAAPEVGELWHWPHVSDEDN